MAGRRTTALAAIASFLQNEFALPDPREATPGSVLPFAPTELPSWTGKTFEGLDDDDRERFVGRELLVVEMAGEADEVRDLFIRLQAGTPLTAQEKRDAWPGAFTEFVIQHAGKPGHPKSRQKPFFNLVPRSRGLTVDDGDHYVDGLADTRKFFAGLAMTIMVREKSGIDFVDLKGKTINDFYRANLEPLDDDPGGTRVIRLLDRIAELPDVEKLREPKPLTFQLAFHFAILVDSFLAGNYVPVWRDDVVRAFNEFRSDVANARLVYRNTRQSLPHHERFIRFLGGSGSDTADVIRNRHAFLLNEIYPKIRIKARDPDRCFDALEKEVIWNRDRGLCKNPVCGRRVPFKEANIHHVIEHTVGGKTVLENGILVCSECHSNRAEMQRLTSDFQSYLAQIYATPGVYQIEAGRADDSGLATAAADDGFAETEGRVPARRLTIKIDWGALDIDREPETISQEQASDSILKLLTELITVFGKMMEEQLTEIPIVRFPLSRNPATDFVNRANGKPFSSLAVPGTDLYFCPHSGSEEKARRLSELFSRLTLPDGRNFPPSSVEISLEAAGRSEADPHVL